jgi:hypothetical protein
MNTQKSHAFTLEDDGFWHQESSKYLDDLDEVGELGALLCNDLNQQRKTDMTNSGVGYKYVPGFGVKNRTGTVIYDSGIKRKRQRLYYDEYETNQGDGHYVFDRFDENYPSFIDYWFVLENDGYWVQMGDLYIDGIDGKESQQSALDALNYGEDKGIGIKNRSGCVLTKYL